MIENYSEKQTFFRIPLVIIGGSDELGDVESYLERNCAITLMLKGEIGMDDFLDFLINEQGYDLAEYFDMLDGKLHDLQRWGYFEEG